MVNLKIATLNARGLIDNKKRKHIFSVLHDSSYDIICIQESHCTDKNVNQFISDWNGEARFALTDSSHSRGVCILFKSILQLDVQNCHSSDDGRLLLLNLLVNNIPLTVCGVYAPNNETMRCSFFKKIKFWIRRHCLYPDDLIILGDFNCCVRDIDRSRNTHLKDKSRHELNHLLNTLKLLDMWHKQYPQTPGFTWRSSSDNVSSRLDYIFTSEKITKCVKNIDILYTPETDHKLVYIDLCISSKNNGPGYWKLNAELLNNKLYVEGIHNIIKNISQLTHTSKRVIWEILKIRIKEFSIQFAVKNAKAKSNFIMILQNELKELDDKVTSELLASEKTRKTELKQTLEKIYKDKEKGALIRSKATWVEQGETSSKYFFNLEKTRQSNNVIKEIKTEDNNLITDDEGILDQICIFYDKLYTSNNPDTLDIENYLENINTPNILTNSQKEHCDKPFDMLEFDKVVDKLKLDKSPGDDGITSNFYKRFWADIKQLFFDMILESCSHGELPSTMKRAIIALLFKKGEIWRLKNYRPISLTNCDYKIFAFVLAERMQKVINEIVNDDQAAYVRKRFIGYSSRTIIDIMDYCEKFNKNGILLCLDFEKAFDSLEWSFLFKVLEKFNFGETFINWIKVLYNKPVFMFKNNGWLSRKILPSRGIRQGCPISALLFITVIEILAIQIRNEENIKGITVHGTGEKIKIKQYADDTTLILQDLSSIDYALMCLDTFGQVAGLKLNKSKTVGVLLGPLRNQYTEYGGVSFTNDAFRCLGIFIGHDTDACYLKNWTDKILFFEQTLERWKKRNLTYFGRVLILKTIGISKFVFLFSVLPVPLEIRNKINKIMFKFIWNGSEKIKRNTLICSLEQGGLNMIDVELFIDSLCAAWAARIMSDDGKKNIFLKMYSGFLGLTIDQLFLTNIMCDKTGLSLSVIPLFYRNIVYSYNKVKFTKTLSQMNSYDFLCQPLFYNELFVWKTSPIAYKNWLESGIFFVCDMFDERGNVITCDVLLNRLEQKSNWISEFSTVKKAIIFATKDKNFDFSLGHAINKNKIRPHLLHTEKGVVDILTKRSKFFYNILRNKKFKRPNSETYWNSQFSDIVWSNVYKRRFLYILDKKISEFNFKLLHRIVPCGYTISKWNCNVSERCNFCGDCETIDHLLYSCRRVQIIWDIVERVCKVKINFKILIFGFPLYNLPDVEYCLSIVSYYIYKVWLLFSINDSGNKYQTCNVRDRIKSELWWKKAVLEELKIKHACIDILSKIYDEL